jgi:Xaa-Pro aminopeptidase
MVEQDIYDLAERSFGVTKHWHRRMVRAGPNTLCISNEHPPVREIAADDCVFLDLGPVFEEWEADVGRTYVLRSDPLKQKLPGDLSRGFGAFKQYFDEHPDVTGAELYAYAQQWAEAAGWIFGGAIAGHIVGEFPHAHIPGDKALYRIGPCNPSRLREPDANGQTKFWILEIHLVDPGRTFGGFYERLLVPS